MSPSRIVISNHCYVCYWLRTDMQPPEIDFRFTPEADILVAVTDFRV